MTTLRIALAAVFLLTASASAQWLKQPTAGIPRTADGKADLNAPSPKTPDGRIDVGGLWLPRPGSVRDIGSSLKPGETIPFQPWAEKVWKDRVASDSRDDPTANCIVGGVPRSSLVGYPFKILNTPGLVVVMYEAVHGYRQIFTDGRALPTDPNPTWFGYSVGRWDGGDLVVQTSGFNDKGWLDNSGKPATDALKVTERFRRRDFGHMDVEITIDDAKAYTRPWTIVLPLTYQADTEMLEYMCNENNKYFEIIPKTPTGRKPT